MEIQPRYYKKRRQLHEKRRFQEGITESGGLVIDASYYGVTNIMDAMNLFERLIDWTPESWERELVNRDL